MDKSGKDDVILMKCKGSILLAILLWVLSACYSSTTTTSVPEQPVELPPTPFPDTPAPAQIDAPLVESPPLVDIRFLNKLDGWGITETQIVRTNDGGITWYNVTPPEVTETGYGVHIFALDANHVWLQIPDFNNFPNSGFLYRTNDGGLTWTKSATPFSSGDIKFLDEENGWMLADLGVGAGSNAVAIYQTVDGGGNWTLSFTNDSNQASPGNSLPVGGLKSGLVALNMQTAWVSGVIYADGTVYLYRTDDGGHIWSEVNLPLPAGAENEQLSIDRDQMKFVSSQDGFLAVRRATPPGNYVTHTGIYMTP